MPFGKNSRVGVALVALLGLPLSVTAHGNDGYEEGSAQPGLDCDGLPQTALRALPAPIDRWTTLECLPNGQMLLQKQGWSWRFPGSFTNQVRIPASLNMQPEDTVGRYFAAMEVATLEGEAATRLHAKLAHDVPTYQFHFADRLEQTQPKAIYTVRARNDKNGEFVLHMVYRSDEDIWGLVCMPDCVPESLFTVSRLGQ